MKTELQKRLDIIPVCIAEMNAGSPESAANASSVLQSQLEIISQMLKRKIPCGYEE